VDGNHESLARGMLHLQNIYDLEVTRRSGKDAEIERQVQLVSADGN
jgi:hypothetical protein